MAHGLMGLGVVDDQRPIKVGARVKSDPILSTASVIASDVLVKMSLAPKAERIDEVRKILDRMEPGMGSRAVTEYRRLAARRAESEKDQAMFDVVRSEIANLLVKKTFALAKGQGLGQTVAEAQGRTSRGVNDANALFCSFGAGSMAMVGGIWDQVGTGRGGQAGSITSGARAGGDIAGCGAGQLVINAQSAEAQARIAQQGTAQQMQLQLQAEAQREARFQRTLLIGGGGLLAVIGLAVLLGRD